MTYKETRLEIAFKYVQLTFAAVMGAASIVIFLVPAQVVPTGVTGVSVLLNELFGLPVGVMTMIMNVPILYIGYRMLPGGWRTTLRTIYVVVVLSVSIDLLTYVLPTTGYTDDRFLNALFGGIVGGIAGGIVYRGGVNFGGTSTLSLIIQRRFGLPLSSTILYTDTIVIFAAGAVFGVESALFALVVLFLGGVAADYVMEGPSVIRTVFIITDKPQEVAEVIMSRLQRGVTYLPARGMYTGQDRALLYVTVSRSQVNDLKHVVMDADEGAFVVIGQGHTAYGRGFKPLHQRQRPPHEPKLALVEPPEERVTP